MVNEKASQILSGKTYVVGITVMILVVVAGICRKDLQIEVAARGPHALTTESIPVITLQLTARATIMFSGTAEACVPTRTRDERIRVLMEELENFMTSSN
jgi:hypothetical protein